MFYGNLQEQEEEDYTHEEHANIMRVEADECGMDGDVDYDAPAICGVCGEVITTPYGQGCGPCVAKQDTEDKAYEKEQEQHRNGHALEDFDSQCFRCTEGHTYYADYRDAWMHSEDCVACSTKVGRVDSRSLGELQEAYKAGVGF